MDHLRHRLLDAVVLLLLAALLVGSCGAVHALAPAENASVERARTASESFVRQYVDPDGRVVRRDQGGDTVSEGQAYALLLTQAVGDMATFDRVWRWTAEHLQRPDGLLAYRADATKVLDANPASDADVLAAWALLRTRGTNSEEYHRAGRQLAAAVLDREVVTVPRVGRLLAAGPWATGSPATLNPSYWSLPAFTELARLTDDQRWTQLVEASVAVTRILTEDGRRLPPDWARVDGSQITPTPAPNGSQGQAQYGLDAQRLLVWLAVDCTRSGHHLATGVLPLLAPPGPADAVALQLTGEIIDPGPGALPLVATAAASHAAGRLADRDHLLDQADSAVAEFLGYYQTAWMALGRLLLTTDLLSGCGRS